MFFWFLEAVSEDDFNGAQARYFIEFLKTILDTYKKHDIPYYVYPEINMVKHIDQATINQFISKFEDVRSHLPNYLKRTITSDRIEPCGNAQAIYHISQLVLNRNKSVFLSILQIKRKLNIGIMHFSHYMATDSQTMT